MSAPSFRTIGLGEGVAAALAQLPKAPGVAQLLAAERSLVIGRASSVRRWAAGHLGAAPKPRKAKRPRTDLSAVATSVAFAETTSAFQQRLVFERLMALHVPPARRRDLKPAAWLRLDLEERFPRLRVETRRDAHTGLYGPLRDRRTAEAASKRLLQRFPLRPCDYVFEPDPAWPKGVACLYAQVRSCSAPCLARIAEAEYRGLAGQVATLLGDPERRAGDEGISAWVAPAAGCGLVLEPGRAGLELYPVRAGVVLESAALTVPADAADAAVERLEWPEPPAGADDSAWLSAWLHAARRTGAFLHVDPRDRVALAERLRHVTTGTLRAVVR